MINTRNLRICARLGAFRPHKPLNTPNFNLFVVMVAIIVLVLIMAKMAYSAQMKAIVGTSSWYATQGDHTDPWKHVLTASGEKFYENSLTAASWAYPLGTYIKVTNTDNEKSVIVKVNDRGPSKRLYNKGRILDLSKGSFQKIADLNKGIIHVKVQLI